MVPAITFPDELPISGAVDEIRAALDASGEAQAERKSRSRRGASTATPGPRPVSSRGLVSSTQTVATTYPVPDCHRPRSSGFHASMNHRNEPSDALYRDISIMSTAIGTVTPNVRATRVRTRWQ